MRVPPVEAAEKVKAELDRLCAADVLRVDRPALQGAIANAAKLGMAVAEPKAKLAAAEEAGAEEAVAPAAGAAGEAEPPLREALEGFRSKLGDEDPNTLRVEKRLEALLEKVEAPEPPPTEGPGEDEGGDGQ